jgi:quinol monooxygenase YgiN
MSISLVVALVGTLVAAAGTVVLVARCARTPRADVIAWAIATAGLAVALGAQVLGYRKGFAPITFRALHVSAQLIAPVALAWGIIEVAARSTAARFAGRLAFSALAVVAGVILGIDPLNPQAFGQSWPSASVFYGPIPNLLLLVVVAVTVITALVAAIVAGVRSRGGPADQAGFMSVGVAGLAILATAGIAVRLPVSSGYPALCVLAAGLAVLAGVLAGRFPPAARRAAHGVGDGTGWDSAVPANAWGSGQYGADDSLGLYTSGDRGGDDSLNLYRDSGRGGYPAPSGGYGDTGGFEKYGGTGYGEPDASYDGPVTGAFEGPVTGAFERPVTGAFGGPATGGSSGPDTGGFDGPVTGAFDPLYRPNGLPGPGGDGEYDGRGADAGLPAERGPAALDPGAPDLGAYDIEQLYGQIAIYTLLDHGSAEFDRLAEQVVEQVRVHEPGTIAYVVHGVPSAPLQRILYEVYRDRAAYDEHTQQSYIKDFEVGRRPLVLATNVIELGVRQAKVSPIGPQGGALPLGRPPLDQALSGTPQSGTPPQGRPPFGPASGTPPQGRPPAGTPPQGRPYGAAPGGRRGDRPPGGRAV